MTLSYSVSPYSVDLPRTALRTMIRVVRALYQLSKNNAYHAVLHDSLPSSAHYIPRHHAVMMGYDFHLSENAPKLIEVNTNAGGLWFACLAHNANAHTFSLLLAETLLTTFLNEYALFRGSVQARPRCIVIVDEMPEQQFLYSEMHHFITLFRHAGIQAFIAAPEALQTTNDGLYLNGQRIDLIYNRHCDFYLQSAPMQAIRQAWLNEQVCLTPNPRIYGLLADKQRMVLWSDSTALAQLNVPIETLRLLARTVPQTRWLHSLSLEEVWATRKCWVFKPDNGYASRGVYVGDKLTKGKLAELNPQTTLMQQRIPPSLTMVDGLSPFKTDFRLFVYRNQVLGVTARLYRGQVTNLHTEHGGFARVRLV